jgi:hypothetical protein
MYFSDRFKTFKILNVFLYIKWILRVFVLTKNPILILKNYVKKKSLSEIRLRSGHILYCSHHPHDIITFFVIFIKKDYGNIVKNSVIVDIGANIGFFSIYALINGAKKVYCYEPNSEAFKILKKNIKKNSFSNKVHTFQKAVSSNNRKFISINLTSSPYNQVTKNLIKNDFKYEKVSTVSLNNQILINNIKSVDLLKIDCEGSEYDIFPSLTRKTIEIIKEIRMEVHGKINPLIKSLKHNPFKVILRGYSNLWLIRNDMQ